MMEQRLTLISDDTKEFPNNTNSDFRVRLPERLNLPGSGWHVALLSLTLPNSTVSTVPYESNTRTEFMSFKYSILELHTLNQQQQYTASTVHEQNAVIKLVDVGHVSDGMSFWHKAVTSMDNLIQGAVQNKRLALVTNAKPNPYLIVKRTLRPSFRWDGEDLILEASGSDGANSSTVYRSFDLAVDTALQWGFIEKNGSSYRLGPNCSFTLDTLTITDRTPQRTSNTIPTGLTTLNGKTYLSEKRYDKPTTATGDADPFYVFWVHTERFPHTYVRFSGFVEWRFSGLSATHTNIHHHQSQAVMIYTNLQQSTMVGGVKAQLLRELVVKPTNNDEYSYTEPQHLQWVPISSHGLDIVEVQLADVHGNLLKLPKGKTLATVAIKQI